MVFLLGTFPGQSQPIHNTLNPLMIHREATLCKFLAYSSYAISSFVFLEDTLNFRGYICISLLNFIWFSNLIIIGRLRQLHHCQQIFQGISFFTEFFDERCFFALSCAADFFPAPQTCNEAAPPDAGSKLSLFRVSTPGEPICFSPWCGIFMYFGT